MQSACWLAEQPSAWRTASQIGASVTAVVGGVSGDGRARATAWAERSASSGAGALPSDRRGATTGRVLDGPNASAAQAQLRSSTAMRMRPEPTRREGCET
eukprot:scaffold110043_cov55-Phaeocystis_antarctica.AAC.4